MSDSPIGSSGAKCVAAAISFCEGLEDMRLSNCDIKDSGAKALFEEMVSSQSLKVVDLSRNPITEKCFDALVNLLTRNNVIQAIILSDI